MATKVVMAQLSPTMEEGKLLEWKVQEGDAVEAGDILAEIETDKANMDVDALRGGTVLKILVEAGQTVPVGTLIGIVGDPGEDISGLLEGAAAAAATAAETTAAAATTATATAAESPPPPEATPEPAASAAASEPAPAAPASAPFAEDGGHVKASPLARRIARESGLRLADIGGTGPGGRIIKRDIEAALASGAVPAAAATTLPGAAAPAGRSRLQAESIEVSQMRKVIARRLGESIGPVPHFFLTTEIDMGAALDLRARLNARLESGKVGVNDLIIKVVAEALARHPAINSSWAGETIERHGTVDIGVAVALDEGLITPIVRNADLKGLLEISEEARELIGRAREKRLMPEEYTGATFSISNLGMFEIDQFTAIINPPEAAILAIGQTEEKPVVVDGEITVGRRMRVTMSCDHRVIDGATGAKFLATVKAMLENPLELVL
jgi:pyruvate dehydrogenase E2 component (dihydrolipoyllysine-residue acetyltransferase)